MPLIKIDASAAVKTLRRLGAELANKTRDNTPLMRRISEAMLQSTLANFAAGGRPKWRPLKESTRRGKRRGRGGVRGSTRILRDTGALISSIKARAERGTAIVETDVRYAPAHQFGSPRGNLPARPFFRLTPGERERIKRLALEYLRLNRESSHIRGLLALLIGVRGLRA